MEDFDYSIISAKRGAFQPARKGLRFGNFESIKVLPNVGEVTDEKLKLTGAHFSNKQIFLKVCRWFETWMPWQKRIMLCGTTDRCSNGQLEYLTTALEPVFHRDFSASLQKEKYRGATGKMDQKEDPQIALMKALQMATKGTEFEDDYLYIRIPNKKSHTSINLEEFAQEYVQEIIDGAFEFMYGRLPKGAPSSDQSRQRRSMSRSWREDESPSPQVAKLTVPKLKRSSEEEWLTSESTSQRLPTMTTDSDNPTSGMTGSGLQRTETRNRRLGPPDRILTAPASQSSVTDNSARLRRDKKRSSEFPKHGRHWTFPGCQNLQTPLFSEMLEGNIATDSGTNFTPGYGTGSYVPLQTNKVSTLTWCMKHQRRDSTPASPVSPGMSRQSSHQHNSHISECTAYTRDFFEQKPHTQKLGRMYRALRSGKIRKPDKMTDVSVPLQKTFKNAKWWGKEPSSGRQLVPARQRDLKEHFKKQIKQIWEWMGEWEEFEKGDLLVELIKMCDQDLVRFIAQCLQQRLRDRNDINYLPDKILLHIFSFLPSNDIIMAERVCRRWHYIAAQDELWRIKCQEMGNREGLADLPGLVEEFNQGYSVDWRSAYIELCQIARHAKTPAVQTAQVGETGTKKWLSFKFTELLKKRTQTPESVKITPVSSEMLSSESSSIEDWNRQYSTVVDVPIQFMQAAVVSEESEEDDIEELTMSEFAIQGLAQDFSLFPELGSTTDKPFQPSVKPTELIKFPTGTTTARGDTGGETKGAEGAPKVEDDNTKKKKKKNKKKKKKPRGSEDVALDIRPELAQAKDILSELQGDVGPPIKSLKHPGWVKPVKRVRRLQGHTDAVFCLMFDKCRIFTGSMDRSIRIWDIRSGRSIRKIYGHKGGIRCLQFDSIRIVSGSWDMTIMIWDIIKFHHLATLTGHIDVVSCLQFDPKHMVSGSHDSTIRVWSMEDYQCLRVLRHHRDSVSCLVFDGHFVTSGSADRTIRMANIFTGECVLKLSDYIDAVTALDMQGDLIVGGTLSGKLFFWDKFSGKAVAGVQPHDTTIFKIVFLPKGRGGARFLTAAGDGSIKEWDLHSMTCVRALHGHKGSVRDVRVSGDRIVSCSDDGNVRIWDMLTPPLRLGDKGEDDTIETKTIDQRKDK
ncbi:uncharacterized protein LOC117301177 [Asterias rubens]|uniref:uncharacterized protein LOC117301177 n=1 Tax=Asterias rubens TaxID=7604 RepID=UPI0014551734|nr:uncharacterized protein LOC117301177 [Asterias rubens]XP_033640980.1 uncharacterized protein LOC117301177 [Asterias rubens]